MFCYYNELLYSGRQKRCSSGSLQSLLCRKTFQDDQTMVLPSKRRQSLQDKKIDVLSASRNAVHLQLLKNLIYRSRAPECHFLWLETRKVKNRIRVVCVPYASLLSSLAGVWCRRLQWDATSCIILWIVNINFDVITVGYRLAGGSPMRRILK